MAEPFVLARARVAIRHPAIAEVAQVQVVSRARRT